MTIGNASGAQITYSYFMGSSIPPTPAHTARTANITPIASSSFVPGGVQGDSYAGLGTFDVMKIASPDGGGDIGYASMPQSMAGDGVGIAGTTDIALAFDYAGKMSFALTGGGSLSPQDEAEVIAIISSFRPSSEALQPVTLL